MRIGAFQAEIQRPCRVFRGTAEDQMGRVPCRKSGLGVLFGTVVILGDRSGTRSRVSSANVGWTSFIHRALQKFGRSESCVSILFFLMMLESRSDESLGAISLNELREMAMLEALGLLDSVDESKFEESFGDLSPAQQAELLDLQAAVAAEIAAAGDEEPDRSLRYKVLARLASEIEHDELACGPIASIGSRTPDDLAGLEDINEKRRVASADVSNEQRLRRSAMIWRAAAFVLGSSLLALVVIQQQSLALSGRILELADSNIAFKGLVERLDESGYPTSQSNPSFDRRPRRRSRSAGSAGGGACFVIVETAGRDMRHGNGASLRHAAGAVDRTGRNRS